MNLCLIFVLFSLLFPINVNCNHWDRYHTQLDDELPSINWKDCGIGPRKADPSSEIPELTKTRIQGGELAKTGEFPWFARLHTFDKKWNYLCGGSVINEWWVLTAGHCVRFVFWSGFQRIGVTVGSVEKYPEKGIGTHYEVQTVKIHKRHLKEILERRAAEKKFEELGPKLIQLELNDNIEEIQQLLEQHRADRRHFYWYTAFRQNFYDIALLKLKNPIVPEFNDTHYIVNSICLPKTGIFNTRNEDLMSIGMGATDAGPGYTPVLKKGISVMQTPDNCTIMKSGRDPNETIPFFCIHRNSSSPIPLLNSSSCAGDSGSPSHQYYGQKAVQIGIVSFGSTRKNLCGAPYVGHVRLSLFIPWIRSHISGTDVRVEKKRNHLLIVSVVSLMFISIIICLSLIWILITILKRRPRN